MPQSPVPSTPATAATITPRDKLQYRPKPTRFIQCDGCEMTTHTMIDSQEGFCKWGYYGKGSSAYSENPVVQGGMCAMCNKCAKEYFGHLSRPAVTDKLKGDANDFRASQWASKRKRVEEDEDEKRTHGLTRAPKRSRFVESYKEETTRVRYAGFWVLLDVFKRSFGDPKQHKLKVEKRMLFGKCCQVVFVPKHKRGWYEVDFEEANGVKEGSRTDGNQDKSDDGMISDMYNELKGKLTQCQETDTHIGILEQPGNDSESATGRGSGASVRSGQSGGSDDEAPATNGFEGLDAEYLAEMEEDAEFLERAQSSWASFAMPAASSQKSGTSSRGSRKKEHPDKSVQQVQVADAGAPVTLATSKARGATGAVQLQQVHEEVASMTEGQRKVYDMAQVLLKSGRQLLAEHKLGLTTKDQTIKSTVTKLKSSASSCAKKGLTNMHNELNDLASHMDALKAARTMMSLKKVDLAALEECLFKEKELAEISGLGSCFTQQQIMQYITTFMQTALLGGKIDELVSLLFGPFAEGAKPVDPKKHSTQDFKALGEKVFTSVQKELVVDFIAKLLNDRETLAIAGTKFHQFCDVCVLLLCERG